MNIYKKLLDIQSELKCNKGQYNKFGGYSYRSCEDILEVLKPLLVKHQATVILSDEVKQIGDRYYIEATCKFIDIETGEMVENKALAREDETRKKMDLAQITGSCSSYARKYSLNGMFALDDVKDSDATNKHGKDEPKAPAETTLEAKTYSGPASEKANVKNIWTKEASKSDNVVPLDREDPSEKVITNTEVKFIYSRGLQAGYTQDQVRNHIAKKFNKNIEELTKRECLKIVEGYQSKILRQVEG